MSWVWALRLSARPVPWHAATLPAPLRRPNRPLAPPPAADPATMSLSMASSSFAGTSLRAAAKPKAAGPSASRAVRVAPRAALENQRMATPFDGFK